MIDNIQSIVGIFSSVVIGAITIIQTYLNNKRNSELQLQIAKRDILNQYKQNAIDAYDVFTLAASELDIARDPFVYTSLASLRIFSILCNKKKFEMYQKCNQINVLSSDKELFSYLVKCRNAFSDFLDLFNSYIISPDSQRFIELFNSEYGLVWLDKFYSEEDYSKIESIFDSDLQRKIISKISEYQSLIEADAFDSCFKSVFGQ